MRTAYLWFARSAFDPLGLINSIASNIRGLPHYIRNAVVYSRQNPDRALRYRPGQAWYRSFDRFAPAASLPFHYFLQDLWAAELLYDRGVREHVDVGSRVDGFVSHILPFCAVTYVDIRPLVLDWPGFSFCRGSVTKLPFKDDSVNSLSCLHVIEHIGLGRYGDMVDAHGHKRAAAELTRVLARNGTLLIGTPVGRERVCFDAHRVFDPDTIRALFGALELASFALIDDRGERLITNATFEDARACDYGCGLFEFRKRP